MPHPNLPHPEERPRGARLEGRTGDLQSETNRVASAEPTPAAALAQARRLVVKIGSALLVDEDGEIHRAWLDALVDDLARCRARSQDVIVVSSGAIAVGRRHLGLHGRALRLEEKQAAAATGQIRLAHAYQEALARHRITVAQILLTLEDTEERRRHLNARATFAQLLGLGAVPVVNENDTIATAEIRFGDNDRLAARVAQMASADMLVLLSDIDGLYSADPRHDPAARHIPLVRDIGADIEAMAGSAPPGYSSGGMVTKLTAARIAMQAGCHMLIAEGRPRLDGIAGPLAAIEAGARATLFLPHSEPRSARKAWIAGAVNPAGILTVDDGAVRALRSGKSLLPAGVVGVEGGFDRGDCVIIRNRAGIEAGRGLSAYASGDIRLIAGHKSGEIATILGYRGRDEIIHRDDLVLTEAR
ncbi:MAG: glutamate 5-kinase [Alphaproteobacteria bacterium]|nr:MAG: glutamate 5-kinase [Alphaproteobacteria bacterium]